MASTLVERIAKSKARTAKLEQQRKAELKKEREINRKVCQRRNYIVGELVIKYFPEISQVQPGTKAENAVRFAPLEALLATLAADREWLKLLVEESQIKIFDQEEQQCSFHSETPNV